MRNVYLITVFICVALVSILGLRGTKFTLPPLDVFPEWAFPGMKYQPKLRPQGESQGCSDQQLAGPRVGAFVGARVVQDRTGDDRQREERQAS